MKVYPLIYSRTKLCDYVSGFLVRPSDLDYTVATRYVSVALNEVKYSNGLRHAVFAVGDYIIYGGTACITSALISRILKDRGIADLDYSYKEYGSDQAGRPITFFIGFAVKRSSINNSSLIPDVDLYETYKIYLKYLEKQWLNSTTKTQTLNGDEAIELNVIEYSARYIPETVNNQGTVLLKNYDENSYQDIINFYYHELVINPNNDNSFISSVLPEMLNDGFVFKNTSLYGISVEEYLSSLRKEESKVTGNSANNDDAPKIYSSSSEYSAGVPRTNPPPRPPINNNGTQTVYHSAAQYRQDQEERGGKKSFPTSGKVILAIAIALLVGIILLVAHRISAKKNPQSQPQSKTSVQEQQDENPMTNLQAEAMQVVKDIDNL